MFLCRLLLSKHDWVDDAFHTPWASLSSRLILVMIMIIFALLILAMTMIMFTLLILEVIMIIFTLLIFVMIMMVI